MVLLYVSIHFVSCFQRAVKTMVDIIHLSTVMLSFFQPPYTLDLPILFQLISFHYLCFCFWEFFVKNPWRAYHLISSSCARIGDFNCYEWFSWWWMWLYLTKLILKFASLFKHVRKSQWQRLMLTNTIPIAADGSFKKWVIWHILGWILA